MEKTRSPLTQAVADFVCSRVEVTTLEVLDAVKHLIPAALALRVYHQNLKSGKFRENKKERSRAERVALGCKRVVSDRLRKLVDHGSITRLRRGVYGPGKPPVESFISLVEKAVLSLNREVSPADVVRLVGHHISASKAAKECNNKKWQKRWPLERKIPAGRELIVGRALAALCTSGRVRRVRRGVYAPPAPKLRLYKPRPA